MIIIVKGCCVVMQRQVAAAKILKRLTNATDAKKYCYSQARPIPMQIMRTINDIFLYFCDLIKAVTENSIRHVSTCYRQHIYN